MLFLHCVTPTLSPLFRSCLYTRINLNYKNISLNFNDNFNDNFKIKKYLNYIKSLYITYFKHCVNIKISLKKV